ncbi:septum formation family protein [Nocardioides acrostichi]|uniref:Septum formation family protein n=1 Tax=Nocardioides acrostichi TaxID=2784339 RepID=A0A930UX61_9ACTN|nr:septum formation family protein [Nocardioides acrostichi]MBF4161322.1 septum formation family protein [Nocardioides acrostichi]
MSPTTHRLAPALGLTALLISLLVALTPSAARADDPPADPDPMAGAPTVGTCSRMTFDEATQYSAPDATYDCTTRHTTKIVALGTLPDGVSWDQPAKVKAAVGEACGPAWQEFSGTDPLRFTRSLLTGWWFAPSQEQQDAGARWIRCDESLTAGQKLVTVKTKAYAKVTKRAIPNSVGRCVTSKYAYTLCSAPHAWKHTGAFYAKKVSDNQAKGQKQLERKAKKGCPSRVKGNSYVWSQHYRGHHTYVIVCYSKD